MRLRLIASVLFAALLPTSGQAAGDLRSALRHSEPGETLVLPGFEFGHGKALVSDVHLKRMEVYAPGARLLEPLADGSYRELPRSDRLFFITDKALTATRMAISFDKSGRTFEGAVFNADGTYSFEGAVVGDRLQVTKSRAEEESATSFSCGTTVAHSNQSLSEELRSMPIAKLAAASPKGATHTAVVAMDTDNEFMNLKFSDNTTNAANYLAQLITNMNVFYNRDLGIQLLQGTSILRRSSAGGSCTAPCTVVNGTDPYSQSSTSSQLNEVGSTWLNTPSLLNIDRAFVLFLSGKSPNNFGASGIAWVLNGANTNYCAATGQVQGPNTVGHFSVTQVFKFAGSTAATDTGIVGHELGHNFGARHTHCTALNGSNPTNDVSTGTIDQCFNAETGCYSGTPSCPNDNSIPGQGSLMSYCNFSAPNGAACAPNGGQVLNEFHPTHEAFLATRITTNINNGCFDPLGGNVGPTITANSPASGSTTAMSGGTIGAQVTRNITFNVNGGSGAGTTDLVCQVNSGTVAINSGGTQLNIPVGGSTSPVVARFTLTGSAQAGQIGCTATPDGGSVSNFTYNFTAPAGTAPGGCNGQRIIRSGFENTGDIACP